MVDATNDNEEFNARPEDGEPSIDEELMALSGPPPSLRYGVITLGVIALSIVMLVWFLPDFKYLLQAFNQPQNLGDAASIDVKTLKNNSYASVEGIPWVTRTLAFNDGVKWFPNTDNSRKLFPLTGQQKLFIQWSMPEAHKAYRDPNKNPERPPLPGYFEGHLVRVDQLGRNYSKVWAFVETVLKIEITEDSWILIDGEMPSDKLWVIPIYLVLLTIIVINSLKLRQFWIAWRS